MTVGRSTSPRHQIGAQAEDFAARYVQDQGYRVIAQNYHQRCGEIDLIVCRDQLLVFIEVRRRKVSGYGDALQSVTSAKQRKLYQTAQHFLQQHPQYQHFDCRFDVLAFNQIGTQLQLEWIEAAFME
jgi:putative endonuclease